MHLSTRRSISRAAVLGLLATTPLIAGWATPDRAPASTPPAGSTADVGDVDASETVHLTAFGAFEPTWRDVAPNVEETLQSSVEAAVVPGADGGLTAAELAAIDTSGVTVTVLSDERVDDDATGDDATGDDATGDDVTGDAPAVYIAADGEEVTAERIHDFLDGRDAPMTDQAEAIVVAGITHDVDPRVVVGIAIAESNAGERLPVGSHNAWGWGGSGRFGLAHWESWDEALDVYTERLGALYDTDDVDRSFAETYCPPNWRWWLDTVTWVIDEI